MKDNELVGYVLVLIFVTVVLILAVVFLGPPIGDLFQRAADYDSRPCRYPDSFECKSEQVARCLATEEFTREECIILIGGGGK